MDFLETSAKTLEKLFDLLCGFPRLQETVKKHTENMYGKCSDLRLLAQKINNKVNVEIAKMPKPGLSMFIARAHFKYYYAQGEERELECNVPKI